MRRAEILLEKGRPLVVGSAAGTAVLGACTIPEALAASDIVEIRLDLLAAEAPGERPAGWAHLAGLPLLFTARSPDEGGAGGFSPPQRSEMLEAVMDDASLIDIEVGSIPLMKACLEIAGRRNLPWIASFHDFGRLPADDVLRQASEAARAAGAAAFKVAAMLSGPEDLARLADFQLTDHGIPVATMGMGPLAPVSRLLCAQCGSVLNYGYLGDSPTAPGQWDSASLKQAIGRLVPFRR